MNMIEVGRNIFSILVCLGALLFAYIVYGWELVIILLIFGYGLSYNVFLVTKVFEIEHKQIDEAWEKNKHEEKPIRSRRKKNETWKPVNPDEQLRNIVDGKKPDIKDYP